MSNPSRRTFIKAAGVLAGQGSLHFTLAFILAVAASLISDFLWYLIGRLKGGSVLSLLCKISLKPDSCVRRTSDLFYHHGARSLLLAKFIPGLSTIAPPLAGIFRMSPWRFFLYDGLGAGLWAGLFMGLGYLLSDQIEEVAAYAMKLGTSLTALVFGSLAAYILWKYIQRRRFLRVFAAATKATWQSPYDRRAIPLRHVALCRSGH